MRWCGSGPSRRSHRRSASASAHCPRSLTMARSARALLEALLPLDAERRVEASVLQVLSASALTEPGLQPIWREVDGTIRDVCAQALRAQGVRGDIVALDHLHTLMAGLSAQLMNRGEGRSTQWVHAVLERELTR